jgi:hypothetical protein
MSRLKDYKRLGGVAVDIKDGLGIRRCAMRMEKMADVGKPIVEVAVVGV